MPSVTKTKGGLTVTAYVGDRKTLLAFDLAKSAASRLAGFSILVGPPGVKPYYTLNELQFETPSDHAQDPTLPANSSVNAPIHKFRWLHVPGSANQGVKPVYGKYTYTVTPRYFDAKGSMLAIDSTLGIAVSVDVGPFRKKSLSVGFTRGFVQSQAFVRHFGPAAQIRPSGKQLQFDTSAQAGVDSKTGQPFSWQTEYEWLGFGAREMVFDLLDEVRSKKTLRLDVFAYDLNEPDVVGALLALAAQGRVRVILDNAGLHHASPPKPEDQFETLFRKAMKGNAGILRGKFGRYSHDKVFIVSESKGATKVLTGSTNLSVTGLYVNSNHVLLFEDATVASKYAEVFEEAWNDGCSAAKFRKSPLSAQAFSFSKGVPAFDVTF